MYTYVYYIYVYSGFCFLLESSYAILNYTKKKQIIANFILLEFKNNYSFSISKIFNLCTYIEIHHAIVRLTSWRPN